MEYIIKRGVELKGCKYFEAGHTKRIVVLWKNMKGVAKQLFAKEINMGKRKLNTIHQDSRRKSKKAFQRQPSHHRRLSLPSQAKSSRREEWFQELEQGCPTAALLLSASLLT